MVVIWITLALFVSAVQGGLIHCKGNTRYVAQPGAAEREEMGRCEKCPSCNGGGFILNRTASREKDDRYGFLSCWPCEPCRPGTFREAHASPVCNMCSKNCFAVNRYESQPCGGSSPGHCGECKPGFKAMSSSAEGMCVKTLVPEIPEVKSTPSTDNIQDVSTGSGNSLINVSAHARTPVPEIPEVKSTPSTDYIQDVSTGSGNLHINVSAHARTPVPEISEVKSTPSTDNIQDVYTGSGNLHINVSAHARIDGGLITRIVGGVFIVAFLFAMLVWYLKYRKHPQRNRRPQTDVSSNLGDTLNSASKLIHSDDTLDGSVEVDGPVDKKVRRELEEVYSIDKLTGLKPEQCTPALRIPYRKFDSGDAFTTDSFMCLSKKIPPNKRNAFFKILDLEEGEYLPEEELWKSNPAANSHADVVYNVLLIWLHKHYAVANLSTLCEALNNAGCDNVRTELVSVAEKHGHLTEPKQVY